MTTPRHQRSALPPMRGRWYWLAELGCLGLGIGLAASTARLFVHGGPVVTLAAVALAAWALALALRRSPLPSVLSEAVHLGIGVLVLLALIAPETRFGPLPTPGSVQTLAEVIRNDFSAFNDDIAPLIPRDGHMALLGSLVWLLALFCSTTAMRLRAPVQAAVPHVVTMLALGLLAREQGRFAASIVLLSAIAVYALSQTAWRNAALRWLPVGRSGVARPLIGGTILLVLVGLSTALLSPLSPVTWDPAIDVRRGGLGDGDPRTVVSPFVEVGSNLGVRSNDLLFTVNSPRAGYWRLTSLDTYDPTEGIWVLSNSYEAVDGNLAPPPESGIYDADISIRNLGGIWVPAPQAPFRVDSPFEVNWDNSSESIISRDRDLAAGDDLTFFAGATDLAPSTLRNHVAGGGAPGLVDDSGTPQRLADLAEELTNGLSDYDAAIALQNYFRDGFTYDETVDYSDDADPLESFLERQAGFCQQFSTGFALAARSIGFPTRVVVGFTPGDSSGLADSGQGITFAVRGRHAHAWPEVHFEGIGWVPFEPTPGRGDPSTSALTGVPAEQASPPEGSSGLEDIAPAPPEAPETTEAQSPAATADLPANDAVAGAADPGDSQNNVSQNIMSWGPGLLALLFGGIAVGLVLLLVRRRHHDRAEREPDDPVYSAWLAALSKLEQLQIRPEHSETPVEFAHRAGIAAEVPALVNLALMESARRWSPEPTSTDAAKAAELVSENVRAQIDQILEAPAATEQVLVSR